MFHRMRHSIFGKFFLLFALSWLTLNAAFIIGSRHGFEAPTEVAIGRRLVKKFLSLLVSDIGSPPSQAKIAAIEADLDIRIRVEDSAGQVLAGKDVPSSRAMHEHKFRRNPWRLKIGRHYGRFFLIHTEGNQTFIFTSRGRFLPEIRWEVVIIAFLVILTVFFGMFKLVRRILRPIEDLMVGVDAIGKGDWNHRVPLRRTDELGTLAQSFNKMSEKIGRMIANREQLLLDVSHELRSPLARLRLGLEFLPQGPARDSVAEDVDELDRLTGKILESARMDHDAARIKVEVMDVGDFVRSYVAKAPMHANVCLNIEGGSMTAHFAADALTTVIKNVLENAQKYGEGSGKPIDIQVRRSTGGIEIEVLDHGPGINAEELPRVFEPFFRADRSRNRGTGGYGFGLHMCQRLMLAMGGKIEIFNRPEGGLGVRLWLAGGA